MKPSGVSAGGVMVGKPALGKFYQGAPGSLLTYWTPSFKSDILAGGDGTILTVGANKYLRCIRGRHFLITGYDFPSDWTKGIPYKSAATISAPAGDAVLIAADVNNFLYAVDGTPNQIPVVSCFQDIEYAHKIAFKHTAQSVDANGVETVEPKVSEWAVYGNAKAGDDITTFNTYWGVPAEATSNVRWVDGVNGDDATQGQKATPVKTIKRAIALASAGHTIYVKSGICTETNGAYNILLQKALTITATGFTQIKGGGDLANPILRIDVVGAVTINGFIIDGTGGYDMGIQAIQADKIINRCFVRNVDVVAIRISTGAIANYCVVTEKYIDCVGGASKVNTCFFYTANTAAIIVGNATATAEIINNRFITRNGNTFWTYYSLATSIVLKGNTYDINVDCYPSYFDAGLNAVIEIAYNKINVSANLTHEVIYYNATVSGCTFNIHDNTFIILNTEMAFSIIALTDTPTPIVSNNIIRSKAPNNSAITIKSGGSVVGAAEISGNEIELENVGCAYCICIGAEGTSASDDKINGVLVHNNYLKCGAYFDTSKISTITTHAIFIGFNINATIKHNRVEGAGYGIILKHGGGVDVSGVVMYNLIINSTQGIRVKGVKAAKIYNNTVVNESLTEAYALFITNNLGTNECEDFIVKNNIFYSPLVRALVTIVDKDGGAIDYNTFNALAYQFLIVGTVYTTLAAYVAAQSLDAHSVDTDPDLTNYIPDIALDGEVLDAAYDDGLDVTTAFGNATTLPAIVTRQQGATWQKGAFVQA